MDAVLRPYLESDFDVVTSIWFDGWNTTGVTTQAVTLESIRGRLPQEIERGWVIHIATIGPNVVGFLALSEGKLEQLFVAPNFQRNGLGKQLLNFAKTQSPNGFWLSTAADNRRAIRFYEREGLNRCDTPPYPNPRYPLLRFDWSPKSSN